MLEINAEREKQGKKAFDNDDDSPDNKQQAQKDFKAAFLFQPKGLEMGKPTSKPFGLKVGFVYDLTHPPIGGWVLAFV